MYLNGEQQIFLANTAIDDRSTAIRVFYFDFFQGHRRPKGAERSASVEL